MPTPLPARFKLGTAEPADAVAAFQRRGLLQPTFRWSDVWEAEHARAFMVAGVAQADVLQLFADALRDPLRQGKSLKDFAAQLKPQLVAKGWWGDIEITDPTTGELRTTRFNDARLQLIYDTNLRQSYAAGRWASAQRNRARMPLLMYRTMRDERVRASHAQWDGLVLPVDDPFWDTHYPPNGWRCRCTAFALSESDLRRRQARGERITTTRPAVQMMGYRDPRTGEEAQVPVGIDPGWAYNAGKASGPGPGTPGAPPASSGPGPAPGPGGGTAPRTPRRTPPMGEAQVQQAASLLRQNVDRLAATRPELAAAQVGALVRSQNFRRFVEQPVPGEALPVAVLPAAAARELRIASPTVLASGDTVRAMQIAAPGLDPADLALVQLAIDTGTRAPDGADALQVLLPRPGGAAVLVRLVRSGPGYALASLQLLGAADAARNTAVQRLLALRARQQGAAGG
jgi:SPP1 gp7 family putative phage head morphogenesis protein